jgi:hypothetical protein
VTPIERAARALCVGDPDQMVHPAHQAAPKSDCARPLWQTYVPVVRAVIAAIREPSEAMLPDPQQTHTSLYAAVRVMDDQAVSSAVAFQAVWQAMIDALLEEGV